MLEKIIAIALLIVSLIHLLPIVGFLSADKLSSIYKITIADQNLEILMRHRAVLFGLLSILFAYSAFQPQLQPLAIMLGFASVLSFFYLSYSVGNFNSAISKVIVADIVALAALVVALGAYTIKRFS